MDGMAGWHYEIIPTESMVGAAIERRPDLIVIIEDGDLYQAVRNEERLWSIPVLFVNISGPGEPRIPTLASLDHSWILKNNPAELHKIISQSVQEPRPRRVLCVDDSPTVLRQIERAFSGTPYTVTTAENGQDALNKLETYTPDLILTDVEMPVLDGLSFCKVVRERRQTADTPLIILSSLVDHKTIARGFEAGADEYLTKPCSPEELLNKAESYLIPPPARRQEYVLIASDDATVTHHLKLALENQGFRVSIIFNHREAAELETPNLIISEETLPGMSGYEFCSYIRKDLGWSQTPFVLMTGQTSAGARKMGKKVGISAYLAKPFTRERLIMLVERLAAEQRSLKALEWDLVLATITSLAKALDGRDSYTRFHSENVAKYATAIGRKAGFNSVQLDNLRLAGLLHDIGKIGVPDVILNKPSRLTDEEFEKIKEHPSRGAEILKPISRLTEVIPAILHHHERIDGLGYPAGLKGDEIPYMARILAVADTFDALITDRPYRLGMPLEKARSIMEEISGTQLSSNYVKLFLQWINEAGLGL